MEIKLKDSYERIKVALGSLKDIASRRIDLLVNPDGYSAESSPIGELKVDSYDCKLSKRALNQLSERLGAGNFIPELADWHGSSKSDSEKVVLEELYRTNIEKLKTLNKNPLLFRLNKDPNEVRGILSNQYMVLNNYELLLSLVEQAHAEAAKSEVPLDLISFDYEMSIDNSDMRCYFVNDFTRFDDNYRGGIVVKNGECGDVAFEVKLILFNTACHNVFRTNIAYGLRHSAERVFRYSELINRMQGDLVYRKAGEMTSVLFNRSQMESYYRQIVGSKNVAIDVDKAQILMRKSFSQQRIDSILEHWKIKEEQNLYGLVQAVTFKAQSQSFEAREKEEEFAGKMIFGSR